MEQLVHMTATYSNALLVAILPHISDFAKKADLAITQPVVSEHVARFVPNPYKRHVAGGIWLTNGYWFAFTERYVDSFRSPANWFFEQEPAGHFKNYIGQTRLTTNEIVAFARESLLKLGYPPELTRADTTPALEGPWDLKDGGHIPQCRVIWEPVKDEDSADYSIVKVEINTQDKLLVGMYLWFTRTNRMRLGASVKVDMEPELESEFCQRTKAKMFVRTNAPPRVPRKAPQPP